MKRIKIFLSDPQVLFREGIHFILSGEDEFEVTGEATNNEEALNQIEANPPQVAILNIEDKKLSGPGVVRRLKRRFPSLSAILTIARRDEKQLFEAIQSGTSACLTKNTSPEDLLDTVTAVSQGSIPIIEELLTPAIAAKILTEFEDTNSLNYSIDNLMTGLTQQEIQILSGIATGNGIEQVASSVNMDEDAIRSSLKLVLNKLVTNDQTRAVISTIQRGLPSVISSAGRSKGLTEDYLTREEFNKFKDTLAKRLKNVVGELV
jgi:two-component system response regulator DevR